MFFSTYNIIYVYAYCIIYTNWISWEKIFKECAKHWKLIFIKYAKDVKNWIFTKKFLSIIKVTIIKNSVRLNKTTLNSYLFIVVIWFQLEFLLTGSSRGLVVRTLGL